MSERTSRTRFLFMVAKADKELLKAINDTKITVEINATDENFINDKNLTIVGGAFGGSIINEDGTITANQTVNPNQAEIIDDISGAKQGVTAMHETLEAYSGAQKSPGALGFNQDRKSFLKAHNRALKLDPRGKAEIGGFRLRESKKDTNSGTATYTGVIWKGEDYRELFIETNVSIKK